MSDVLNRLRSIQNDCAQYVAGSDIMREAADKIERQHQRISELEQALKEKDTCARQCEGAAYSAMSGLHGLHYAIRDLEREHGSLRAAAKVCGVDAGYLKRLRDGEKTNPSDEVLQKLGLIKWVLYERIA